MSGGITQLVATGVQDTYLSGTPEISFFRSSYKRYTHFASNVERQLIQGTPGPTGISTVRFEKKGDLLSHVYLTALDPNLASNVNVNWSSVISKLELMIGGQVVDTQDFTWTSNIEPVYGAQTWSTRISKKDAASSVFFPLKFFFCKDWQNALPLVALQYHDVEIRITWANPSASDQYAIWARFIYLDKDEREWFAKKQHDMLIQQVTRVPMSAQSTYEFALSQPIKYIAFESNSYANVYNTSVPLVNTSTTVQVLVNPGTQPTYLNLQALTSIFQGPTYISAVSGNDVTFSYASQAAVPVPQGQMIDLGLVTLQATGTIASGATSATLTFPGNLTTIYGPNFYKTTSGGALIALTGASTPSAFVPGNATYNANSNVTSFAMTWTTATNAAFTNPLVTFVPVGFTPLASTGVVTIASATAITIPYTGTTLTVGQQVALPQITGQATVVSVVASTSFTLSFVSQTTPSVPSGQEFVVYAPNVFTDTAYTPVSLNQGSAAAANMQFKMQINGTDIGESRHLPHWQDINQYYLSPYGYDAPNPNNVVVIPFCLDTSKLQPTGTLNFSRIDTFRLITPSQTNFQQLSRFGVGSYFYAVNYNILRIQNGMAGILYSS
jgi:hypothetical protein